MPKRFSRLKYALKTLKTSGNFSNPDAATPDAPASSVLADFQKSRKADNYGNITRKDSSKPGDIQYVVIAPFSRAATEANRVSVKASKRAMDSRSTYVDATINHLTGNAPREKGFQPAKATVHDFNATTVGSAANTSKTSQITGIKYNYRGGASFTYPFGRGTGTTNANYDEVKQGIFTQVTNNQPARTVSFTPEKTP